MEPKFFFIGLEAWGALFCLLASVYLFIGRTVIKKGYRALAFLELAVGVMLVFDALAWFYRGVPGVFAFGMVSFANFITFVISAILPVIYSIYVIFSIYEKRRDYTIFYAITFCAIFAEIMLMLSQRNGYIYQIDPETNLYERGRGFALWTLINMSEAAIGSVYLFLKRKEIDKDRLVAVLSFVFIPVITAFVQIFIYGYSLANIACLVSTLIMFAQAISDNVKDLLKQEVMIRTQDTELSNLRNKIALSQIQPQFLYKVLDYVEGLCNRDTKKAKVLVSNLSDYLKGNVNLAGKEEMVPFEGEFEHTKAYLEIEKIINENSFDTEYDIRETDFMLPALSIQPVVENAVRHGVNELAPGKRGKIKVSTLHGNGYIKIVIKDNGVGFETESVIGAAEYEKEMHGLKNVKERLRIMENAEIHVKSFPNRGTTVEIIIPVKK
jgi:sensor histidine kinase YesM